jgi:peptidoglycan/LPS O-acetylase OafA/YrhL
MAVFAGSPLQGQVLFIAFGVSLTLGLALLSWHLWEKQFLKLKRLFPYGRGRRQPARHRAS